MQQTLLAGKYGNHFGLLNKDFSSCCALAWRWVALQPNCKIWSNASMKWVLFLAVKDLRKSRPEKFWHTQIPGQYTSFCLSSSWGQTIQMRWERLCRKAEYVRCLNAYLVQQATIHLSPKSVKIKFLDSDCVKPSCADNLFLGSAIQQMRKAVIYRLQNPRSYMA